MPRTNANDKPETVLEESYRIINGERQKQYGPAKENFADIGDGWTKLLRRKLAPGAYIDPEEVAVMMIWLKACRFINGRDRDSVVDMGGYAGTIAKVMGWDD